MHPQEDPYYMSDNLKRIIGAAVPESPKGPQGAATAEEQRKGSVPAASPPRAAAVPLEVYSTQVVPFTSETPRPVRKLEFA